MIGFLNDCYVRFADVDNEVLGFVREKVLNDIKNRNLILRNYTNKDNGTGNLTVKVKFTGFKINISGENVIKDYVLDKVTAVIFLAPSTTRSWKPVTRS